MLFCFLIMKQSNQNTIFPKKKENFQQLYTALTKLFLYSFPIHQKAIFLQKFPPKTNHLNCIKPNSECNLLLPGKLFPGSIFPFFFVRSRTTTKNPSSVTPAIVYHKSIACFQQYFPFFEPLFSPSYPFPHLSDGCCGGGGGGRERGKTHPFDFHFR